MNTTYTPNFFHNYGATEGADILPEVPVYKDFDITDFNPENLDNICGVECSVPPIFIGAEGFYISLVMMNAWPEGVFEYQSTYFKDGTLSIARIVPFNNMWTAQYELCSMYEVAHWVPPVTGDDFLRPELRNFSFTIKPKDVNNPYSGVEIIGYQWKKVYTPKDTDDRKLNTNAKKRWANIQSIVPIEKYRVDLWLVQGHWQVTNYLERDSQNRPVAYGSEIPETSELGDNLTLLNSQPYTPWPNALVAKMGVLDTESMGLDTFFMQDFYKKRELMDKAREEEKSKKKKE